MVWYEETLKLERDERFFLAKYSRADSNAHYEVRFMCTEDIDKYWSVEGAQLVFRVYAQDSFSSFSVVESHTYFDKKAELKDGFHRFGDSLEVEGS